MHTLATRIKDERFETIKNDLWKVINEICNNLPCPDCRNHAVSLMSKTNKEIILLAG